MSLETGIKLTRRKLKRLVKDAPKSAEAVNLRYVTDAEPGIVRMRRGEGFIYKYKGRAVTDKAVLHRIRSLVIPPAWEKVWICISEDGHLQVTGYDIKGRKQYRYHPLWNTFRNQTKYFHLHDFGKALPLLRSQIKSDLSRQGLPQQKVLAAVVLLMQCTCIRIGSQIYEKLNGSFGLTTLKDKHVQISGSSLKFCFKGKKGVFHDISFRSRKLARIVQACKDIPGKELFQYYDEQGQRRSIDSGMVNNYIKTISGGEFTAKDFRTWAGSLQALEAFRSLGGWTTQAELKRKTVQALDHVASVLGNTRTVCRKYYVHPAILELYEEGKLQRYLDHLGQPDCELGDTGLSPSENTLMKLLEVRGKEVIVG